LNYIPIGCIYKIRKKQQAEVGLKKPNPTHKLNSGGAVRNYLLLNRNILLFFVESIQHYENKEGYTST
jgi:hypothetical protein